VVVARRFALAAGVTVTALAGACALAAGALAAPITEDPTSMPQAFSGAPASPNPIPAPEPPRHPHMAPNGRSNLHDDTWQTDAYRTTGPLGKGIQRSSFMYTADCASITFDSQGRLVAVCVGLDRPTLRMLDPQTLDTLASLPLPLRQLKPGSSPFQSFGGGGYFYLDDRDRAVVPTPDHHLYVVSETAGPGFAMDEDIDLTSAVPADQSIISALPDWSGRVWFVTDGGVVGTVDLATKRIGLLNTKEPIGNSFATGEDGDAYIVSDGAMYRFTAGPDGTPRAVWRTPYANVGVVKPGQTEKGSGTTPTLMPGGLVAITDNADPMDVVVMRRSDGGIVCTQPVFDKGTSDSDQSLIGVNRSMIVENNYGYTGPAVTEQGGTTAPGLARVDLDASGGCHVVWVSKEIAPTVVPKLSLANGLVYTYTKPAGDKADPWYLTALDFQTGKTVFKQLAGAGLGFNNNYAPVTLAPDGTLFIGTLGGIVSLRDATPPNVPPAPLAEGPKAPKRPSHRVSVRFRCLPGGRVRVRVAGAGAKGARISIRAAGRHFGRRGVLHRRRPFNTTARVRFPDGTSRTLHKRFRRCLAR